MRSSRPRRSSRNPFFDIGTVDILRTRERGVPRYNEFRRQLGLNPIESFDDLADEPDIREELKAIYGDKPEDVEQLDLLIGTLAGAIGPPVSASARPCSRSSS